MPYEIVQISPRRYSVVNPKTGHVHAYSTTLQKADAQVRLLRSKEQPIKKKSGK